MFNASEQNYLNIKKPLCTSMRIFEIYFDMLPAGIAHTVHLLCRVETVVAFIDSSVVQSQMILTI